MIEVIKVQCKPDKTRLGKVIVNYHNLLLMCELCAFKDENFWIRMPEVWTSPTFKKRYAWFATKEESDAFQAEVLKQVYEIIGMPIDKTVIECKDFFISKKELT